MANEDINPNLWAKPGEITHAMWNQPEAVIEDPTLQTIYLDLIQGLINDLGPNASTLDLMTAERIASFYATIRSKEQRKAFYNDRQHKEHMKTWIAMVANLRAAMTKQKAEDDVVTKMATAVFEAAEGLPPDQARMLKDAVMATLADIDTPE